MTQFELDFLHLDEFDFQLRNLESRLTAAKALVQRVKKEIKDLEDNIADLAIEQSLG